MALPATDESEAVPLTLDDLDEPAPKLARRRWFWPVSFALGVLVFLFLPISATVNAECVVSPVDKAVVRTVSDGFVKEVLVEEGAWVKRGEPLARIDTNELDQRLTRRRAELAQAQSELRQAEGGTRPEELARQRAVVEGKARALALAKAELARVRDLVSRQLASLDEKARAAERVTSAQAEVNEASAQLKLFRAGVRPEEIERRRAEVEARASDLALVESEVQASQLLSPIEGVVTTARLRDRRLSFVSAGTLFAQIEDVRRMSVTLKVPENELDVVTRGQKIQVKVANLPAETFESEVSFISPVVEEDAISAKRFFRVEGFLDNSAGALKPNTSGYAKISVGRSTRWHQVQRTVLRWLRLQFLL